MQYLKLGVSNSIVKLILIVYKLQLDSWLSIESFAVVRRIVL